MYRRWHDQATFFRFEVFDVEAGLHAVAQDSPLRAQQFSVR
jgi:hypothetical protein